MSRSKARRLKREGLGENRKVDTLANYRYTVGSLACAARLFYLPLGVLRTGNRPND